MKATKKNSSSKLLPIPLTLGVEAQKLYKKSKKMKEFDHQIKCEKVKIRRELKVANGKALFRSKLLKEITCLPNDEKLSLFSLNGSSISDTYYSSKYKLPQHMTLPRPIITSTSHPL